MRSERRVAIAVGALYIVATAAGLLAAAALGSLLQGPGALANLAAHATQIMATAFFELVMVVAVAGVAFMIYPILKQDADTPGKQGLALWYVGTRITEGSLFLVGGVADRERVQFICNRFRLCKNSDERAFERCIDLQYRGEGGLKILPNTLSAQLHINARGIDLKKRTQHKEKAKC
jgi:Domain of unknown function (DUF4386)